MRTVVRRSRLDAAASHVWAVAVTSEGINDELFPILRMTVPRGGLDLDPDTLVTPAHLGRSWLLLGRVLPVDYDDLTVDAVWTDPDGGGFRERSRTSILDPWHHDRQVAPIDPAMPGHGCEVTDRLTFAMRGALGSIPGAEAVAARIVGLLFTHRHRRLARRWGGRTSA